MIFQFSPLFTQHPEERRSSDGGKKGERRWREGDGAPAQAARLQESERAGMQLCVNMATAAEYCLFGGNEVSGFKNTLSDLCTYTYTRAHTRAGGK